MTTQEVINGLKGNPRWKTVEIKVNGKDATPFNLEEINLLYTMTQLETQEESRNQGRRMVDLSEKMAAVATESANMARKMAIWTKWLAIATVVLAIISALGILLRT